MCGADTIHYYCLQIFEEANMKIDKYVLAVLMQLGFASGYLVSAFLMKAIRRRTQYLSTGVLLSLSMLLLGYSIQVNENGNGGQLAGILKTLQPAFAICACLGYSFGFAAVIYGLGSEIFPSKIKGLCTSLALATK